MERDCIVDSSYEIYESTYQKALIAGEDHSYAEALILLYSLLEEQRIIRYSELYIKILAELSEIYLILDDPAQSAEFAWKILAVNDSDIYQNKYVLLLLLANDMLQAESLLKQIDAKQSENSIEYLLCRALWEKYSGNIPKVRDYLQQILDRDVNRSTDYCITFASLSLAEILMTESSFLEAANYLKDIAMGTHYINLRIKALQLLHNIYTKSGNTEGSAEALLQSCKLRQKYLSCEVIRIAERQKTAYNNNLAFSKNEDFTIQSIQWITYDLVNYGMSNNLKYSLNMIKLYLETFLIEQEYNPGKLSDGELTRANTISQQVKNIHKYISDFDAVCQKKTLRKSLNKESLQQMIKRIISRLGSYIENHKVFLNYKTKGSTEIEMTEPLICEMIFINILDFSIKALHECNSGERSIDISSGTDNGLDIYINFTYKNREIQDKIDDCLLIDTRRENRIPNISSYKTGMYNVAILLEKIDGEISYNIDGDNVHLSVVIPGREK